MEITKELRELARFSAGALPVVSLYLDTQWRDQHQRERVATFVMRHVRQARALLLDSDPARASLEQDLDRITQWEEKRLHGMAESNMLGVALFACAAVGLWVEFPSPVPFEDEFTIADRPMLRQLARLDEDYTNALLVMIDSRAARVYEVVLGGLLRESDFANEVPDVISREDMPSRATSGTCRSTSTAITRKLPPMWLPIWRPIHTPI